MSAVALVGAWLLGRKQYQAAVIWMASGVWVTITGIALFHDGVRTPIYFAHPIVVIFLGWVVSTRAAIVTVALTSATTLGFIVADALGWRPPTPPILHGIVQVFVLLLSAALVIYLVQAYRERLEQMQLANGEIARANEVLRQSELKFATAFASSPVAASIVTVEDGRILAVNDNFLRDFGWARTEMEGHLVKEAGLWLDPQLRQQWRRDAAPAGAVP